MNSISTVNNPLAISKGPTNHHRLQCKEEEILATIDFLTEDKSIKEEDDNMKLLSLFVDAVPNKT